MSVSVIQIHPEDNVAVAVSPIPAGTNVVAGGEEIQAKEDVPQGHKIALKDLVEGDRVVKYGHVLGRASRPIRRGEWVHSHNLATLLSGSIQYEYHPSKHTRAKVEAGTFEGYRRADGRVGTRNEIWVLNTVGCVNRSAQRIAQIGNERFAGVVDGVHSFAHPFGCSQLGDDLRYTQRILAGLLRHPNAGGVLLIGLGCENNQLDDLLRAAGDVDRDRIRSFNSQQVVDEVQTGVDLVAELVEQMKNDRRTTCDASELVVGLKCGGSDAFSGLTANPLVGRIADRLSAAGGTAILTEVPEMFGAEQQLMDRAIGRETFERIVAMIDNFKGYFVSHGQPVYENPSPGNKEGGLTTLEEKSLGATQKGGRAPVTGVLDYGEPASPGGGGLSLLYAPGNDGVSVTAEVASGATLVLFTTGRGTPLGFPVPTLKISSNSDISQKKPHWIDFDAGPLLEGRATLDELEDELFSLMLRVASGEERARNEVNDYREIAIWKEGVTL
ncbi:MAG: altronate dehydratase family protein [Rhodothermales bacterium]